MDTRERIQAAIRENPNQMTMLLAKQFGVPEVEVVRAFPDDRAVELHAERWEELIRRLEAFGKVHVIVSNGGATLEANGQFGNLSTTGDFFNVQTSSLDMHIRWREIGAVFAVEKPGHLDGKKALSFQFFDVSQRRLMPKTDDLRFQIHKCLDRTPVLSYIDGENERRLP